MTIPIRPEHAEHYRNCGAVLLEMEPQPQPWRHDNSLMWHPPHAKWDERTQCWHPSSIWRADMNPMETGAAGIVEFAPVHPCGMVVFGFWSLGIPGCGVDDKWCHQTCKRHGRCMYGQFTEIPRRVTSITPVLGRDLTEEQIESLGHRGWVTGPSTGSFVNDEGGETSRCVLERHWNATHETSWNPELHYWFTGLETHS